jgi:mevalonate kinase
MTLSKEKEREKDVKELKECMSLMQWHIREIEVEHKKARRLLTRLTGKKFNGTEKGWRPPR